MKNAFDETAKREQKTSPVKHEIQLVVMEEKGYKKLERTLMVEFSISSLSRYSKLGTKLKIIPENLCKVKDVIQTLMEEIYW